MKILVNTYLMIHIVEVENDSSQSLAIIKNLRKDFFGIISLDVDGMCLIINEKAEALKQFYTFLEDR